MPLTSPWGLLLKHVLVKKKRGLLTSKKLSRDRRSRDDLQRHHRRHSCEKHVKTVTVRAESLATTEADFFETLGVHAGRDERTVSQIQIHMKQTWTGGARTFCFSQRW